MLTLFMMLIQAEAASSQNAAAVVVNRAPPNSVIKGQSQPRGGSKISTEVRILLFFYPFFGLRIGIICNNVDPPKHFCDLMLFPF